MGTLTAKLRTKAQSWAFSRQGRDTAPLTLDRRRIYILPTKQGIAFAVLLFAMLMGSMNYNNNLGFALTFGLAGMALVCMFHCHRNLCGLIVKPGQAESVFVGQTAKIPVQIRNPSTTHSLSIRLVFEGQDHPAYHIPPNTTESLYLSTSAKQRGKLIISKFGVATQFPMGLFRAWAWIALDLQCLVFPKPHNPNQQPPTDATDTGGAQDARESGDDFAGLREFNPGDPPRHVAWKSFARNEELMVRQFAGTSVASQWLDYHKTPAPDVESKLSMLCYWILEAHQNQTAYGLRLPGVTIPPNLGDRHKRDCLTALALFGVSS